MGLFDVDVVPVLPPHTADEALCGTQPHSAVTRFDEYLNTVSGFVE